MYVERKKLVSSHQVSITVQTGGVWPTILPQIMAKDLAWLKNWVQCLTRSS